MKTGYKFATLFITLALWLTSESLAQTTYTWSGATSSAFAESTNWTPAGVPGANERAVIPGGVTNFPVMTGSRTLESITVEENAKLELLANTSAGHGTLTVHNDMNIYGELILTATTTSWVASVIVNEGKLINNGLIISDVPTPHTTTNSITANTTNFGQILLQHNLSFIKNGGTFTNSGSIEIGEGLNLNFTTNGILEFLSGAFTGPGSVNLTNMTFGLESDFTTPAKMNLVSVTIDGPGKFSVNDDSEVTVRSCTVNASFENRGTSVFHLANTLSGETVENGEVALLSVRGNNSFGHGSLIIQNDLKNNGNMDLTGSGSGWTGTLTVHNGKLINEGTFSSSIPSPHASPNIINANIENSGEIVLNQHLNIIRTNGLYTNSGMIEIGEDLNLNISNNGTLEHQNGSITGSGVLNLTNSTLSLANDFTTTVHMNLVTVVIDGAGKFIVGEEKTVLLRSCTINTSYENRGISEFTLTSTLSGETVENRAGALFASRGNNSYGHALITIKNDLNNEGELILSGSGSGWTSTLVILEGKLNNSGTVTSTIPATHASPNIITANIENTGNIAMEQHLTLNKNGGVISTTGSIQMGDGYNLNLTNNSTLEYVSGIFTGTGVINLTNATMALSVDFISTPQMTLVNSVVDGPGKFTVGENSNLSLRGSTVNAPFENRGNADFILVNTLSGETVVNTASARFQVMAHSSFGHAALTSRNSIINHGNLEIIAAGGWTASLTIAEGNLTNHGSILSLHSVSHATANTLNTEVDNRGRIHIERNLVINQPDAIHFNSGIIDAEMGNLTVTQSGNEPRFINYGSMLISEGQTVTVTNGRFTNSATGIVRGIGSLNVSSTNFDNHGTFMPGSRPAFGMNLIVNGDAESNAAGITTSNIAIAGWTDTGAMSVLPYSRQGIAETYPSAQDPGPGARGSNYFWGGANAFSSSISQTINVAHIRTLIDLEQVNYDLSGYLGGLGSQGDNMKLTARFLSSESAELGRAEIGPVSNTDRENVTGLFFRETDGLLPGGTRSIELTLAASRVSGTEINAFADNLELVLSLIDGDPEGRTTGVLTVIGDFPMSSESARVGIGLGGRISDETYDRLHVTGAATVAGVLMIDIINGLEPVAADVFNVFTYGSRSGEFSFIAGTDLGNDLFIVPEYSSDHLTLTIPGDPISLVAPELLSPGNQSIGVSTNPYLQWSMVPGTAAYHIQVSGSDDFAELAYENERVLAVNLTVSQLDPFVTYFWRSRAVNSKETGEWSQTFSFTTGETVVNIPEEKNERPDEYFLGNNYPNPFNPQTTIRFGLPEAGFVTLDVYDMLGRRVATLVNSNMAAGYHTVMFGSTTLSSGIYFYRISAGEFHQVRKMMMMK